MERGLLRAVRSVSVPRSSPWESATESRGSVGAVARRGRAVSVGE